MHSVGVAFGILYKKDKVPYGRSKVTCYLMFDVKMDFTCKERWVLDGHKTPSPLGYTCEGAVSIESARIDFAHALNVMQVFVADIRNDYLQATSSEKHHIVCGTEFGLETLVK